MKTFVRTSDDARALDARVRAHQALYSMGLRDGTNTYHALKRILGYPATMDDHVFCIHMTIKDVETCELLAGPHGYTIYKMLEARSRQR